jgi:hypothetical protein
LISCKRRATVKRKIINIFFNFYLNNKHMPKNKHKSCPCPCPLLIPITRPATVLSNAVILASASASNTNIINPQRVTGPVINAPISLPNNNVSPVGIIHPTGSDDTKFTIVTPGRYLVQYHFSAQIVNAPTPPVTFSTTITRNSTDLSGTFLIGSFAAGAFGFSAQTEANFIGGDVVVLNMSVPGAGNVLSVTAPTVNLVRISA